MLFNLWFFWNRYDGFWDRNGSRFEDFLDFKRDSVKFDNLLVNSELFDFRLLEIHSRIYWQRVVNLLKHSLDLGVHIVCQMLKIVIL